jgi:hypothetical protein
VNSILLLPGDRAYATVGERCYPSLGAILSLTELIAIDGEVNRKVLYDKKPDQGLGEVEGLFRCKEKGANAKKGLRDEEGES